MEAQLLEHLTTDHETNSCNSATAKHWEKTVAKIPLPAVVTQLSEN